MNKKNKTDTQIQPKERMILTHQPVPGYKTVFFLTVISGITYLVLVFTGVIGP